MTLVKNQFFLLSVCCPFTLSDVVFKIGARCLNFHCSNFHSFEIDIVGNNNLIIIF